jgi:RNA polymerase sigma-70 factor (ECF subfamily)
VADAFRAGDAMAADAVVCKLAPYLNGLVRRLTAWRSDVDDLVQDVLVAALAARRSFRGDARLETWITRIAVNHCRAHARKQWIRRRLFAAWAERKRRTAPCEPAADAAAAVDEQAARVREAIAALPVKYREAIVLCYLQNMSVAEAAESLGATRGAVEVRLSRARQRLREMLE